MSNRIRRLASSERTFEAIEKKFAGNPIRIESDTHRIGLVSNRTRMESQWSPFRPCPRYIKRGKVCDGFPLFDEESLKWPGFVEFDDVNAKVLTFNAGQT